MISSLMRAVACLVLVCASGLALAKLPPAPPVDPAKAEEAKQKAADAAKKEAELLAKYMDLAVANYAAKAKSEGKEFKPLLGPGVPGAPVAAVPAAPAAAAKPGTAPAKK
jgi:hypothetical protein